MSFRILLAKFLLLLSTFFLMQKNTKKTILFILQVMLNRIILHAIKAGNDLSFHQWYTRRNFRPDDHRLPSRSLPNVDKGWS